MGDSVKKVRVLLAAAVLAAMVPSMSGCNTTEGVGEDIEATGDAIKDKAREEKND